MWLQYNYSSDIIVDRRILLLYNELKQEAPERAAAAVSQVLSNIWSLPVDRLNIYVPEVEKAPGQFA